jgi:fatty-acyl-CoA synthase
MYGAMLAHPRFSKTDVNSLRTGIIAGSPCSPALMKRVIEEMHLPELVTAFGMTETSAAGLATARDDPIERRLASVGRVTAHTELKIVDETGAVVPRGVPGELLTRGFSVMRGYWGDPVATAEVIDAEGWMHTGDLVSIDAEGWGTVHGRVRDVINVAGEKVLPGEVEAVLMRHPAVEMAAVFGIPDEARGEVVCACVKPRSGRNVDDIELKAFCRERLTNFKIPRSFGFVEQIPMTATGKIRKFLVKTEYLAPKP